MHHFQKTAAALLLAGLFLTGCGTQDVPETEEQTETLPQDVPDVQNAPDAPIPDTEPETEPAPVYPTGAELAARITRLPDSDVLRQSDIADVVTADRLDTLPGEKRAALAEALTDCTTLTEARNAFHRITGYTFHAWRDTLTGAAGENSTSYTDGNAHLLFTGDVCLGDDWYNMQAYHRMGSDITNNISEDIRGWLAAADVALMNCECSLSDRGEPTPGKLYTFRGKPENARIFAELGVDIVSLANNHVHDYGKDAFLDTMTALENAGVVHVGAGETLEEAMQYKSFVADGMKIAYVAASNAEKYRLTPGATETSHGILLMYEEENVLSAIDKAAREADVVVAYLHWGTENSTQVNADQQKKRDLFIAHGADVIVGAHPHVLQPWEMAGSVPVVYSLGNFWFNMETVDTAMASVNVTLTNDGVKADCALFACVQTGGVTKLKD